MKKNTAAIAAPITVNSNRINIIIHHGKCDDLGIETVVPSKSTFTCALTNLSSTLYEAVISCLPAGNPEAFEE